MSSLCQEQVMQIAQVRSGYSLGEADLLRRAHGEEATSQNAEAEVAVIAGMNQVDPSS